jgi:peptide/nickel transport system permease protein
MTMESAPQLPKSDSDSGGNAQISKGYWSNVVRRLSRDQVAICAGAVILVLLSMAVLGAIITPQDPYHASMMMRLKPMGTAHFPLGTDELGRDMLSRLMAGARMSLFMGITPVVLAFFIGSILGITAGYAGGMTNLVIMRSMDVFYAFPSVLLAIALSGALGAGLLNSLISLTVVFIPPIARVAESVTTQIRTRDFVEAARASGAHAITIVRVHVLGNVMGPIFVYATSLIAVAMILASGLSFLGLGVKPPEPEWGLMLNTLRTAIYVQPWVAALPGAMIFITSMAFNLLSDGLRQAMEIKN